MRILVAEDSEISRDLIAKLLEVRGHVVVGVDDGVAALAALARQPFDVVLMDEEMPRMNGLETTAAIRRMESCSGKHQFIVGISGNATDEDEKRYLDAGMDAFLAKPVGMEKLYQTVESVCRVPTQSPPETTASAIQNVPAEDIASHLRRMTGGNEKLALSLVKTFLSDAPKKLSAIRRAVKKADAEKLASTAHSLKGALAIFDAQEAVIAAGSLESMGRSGNLQGADAQFRALEEELALLKHDLLALRLESKPAKPLPASRSSRKL
jgi:hypothetical protein